MKTIRTKGLALSAMLSLAAGTAFADTYIAASYSAPSSAMVKFLDDFAETINEHTNGELQFNVFSGGSLLPADGSLSGVSANVAQMAQVTSNYVPSDLPLTFMMGDLSFTAGDQLSLALAYIETKLTQPRFLEEAKNNNVVYGSGFVIGIYNYICKGNVASLADLEGKKIRTATGAHVNFSSEIGAVPVQVASTEIYTGIQRGSIDCTAGSPEFLTTFFRLTEVADSVYRIPLGGNANDGFYFNRDFWQSLSAEEREDILEVLPGVTARNMQLLLTTVEEAWTAAEDAGMTLNEALPEDVERLDAFKAKFSAELPEATMERRNVEDPTDLINAFLDNQTKWEGLLADVDWHDEEALTALIQQEIFSKLDPATYGMD